MSQNKQKKKAQKRRVTFKLKASEAREVILAGDFNNWDIKKHVMKKNDKGRWVKDVSLSPGRYEYKFIVDGQWQNDPSNDQVVPDSYGTFNNILTV